ncbi:hypothetical protein VNI00_011612 [Paramarasmius palmivorus]|uniref:MI domain-containing protein n=1 Tax=Paramarasmius palmivorus TaxID=297713 RepID=A0AAW0CB88_9AGAR
MSKSSTASGSAKIPTKLSSQSAWAKGPPQSNSANSPRSQSPAPTSATATHSRRPSTLGQGVPLKDGVSISRNTAGAAKTGSVVSFGSIDDTSAPVSSSTAAPIQQTKSSEGVKSFGSVPATVGSQSINGKSPASTKPSATTITPSTSTSYAAAGSGTSGSSTPTTSGPSKTINRADIAKLFQKPSQSSSTTPSSTSSPSVTPSNLPPTTQPSGQPTQPSGSSQATSHSFAPFVPQNGMRNQPQNSPGRVPGSPVYPRPVPNGAGPRPPNGNGPPGHNQMPASLGSPRLAPPSHPGQTPQMPQPPPHMQQPQMQVPGWPGYYYSDQGYMYPAPWAYGMPQHPGMPSPHPAHPQMPHHPQPPGGHVPPQPPHAGMPMSPRNQPPQLAPGTPTLQHATVPPHSPQPPPSLSHSSSNSMSSMTSPPATPSTTASRINPNANAFVPQRSSKVTIRAADGSEIDFSKVRHQHTPSTGSAPQSSSPGINSPSRKAIKIENPKEKEKKEKEEAEKKAKEAERLKKEKEEAEKKKVEEQRKEEERKKKEEDERKKKEAENLRKKEEERRRKDEEDQRKKKKEEEEKRKKEEEEKERLKKEEEEKKRIAEEQERVRKEEEERKKAEEEAKEKERLRLEEEARVQKEAEEKERLQKEAAKAAAEAEAAKAKEAEEKEEGEIDESKETPREEKKQERTPLKIDTNATPEGPVRRRPGPLDLSTAKSNIPAPLPSALATARVIEDLGSVSYPEGVKSPQVELNVNATKGKFRYDRDFLLQFMSICKEKPDMLPPLDAIGIEPVDQSNFTLSRGGSGRHRQASGATPSRSASIGLGFGTPAGFGKPGAGNPFGGMGNFGTTPASKLQSEERFKLANGGRSVSTNAAGGMQFTRPGQMHRTASQGGPGSSGRTRSKRGGERDPNKQTAPHSHHAVNAQPPLEPVAPLQVSANRWDRKTLGAIDADSPEVVDRKVKGLLNKITMEKFDSISDQIIAWANKSENEKDGRTLIQVIRLVFEKATDEANFSEMYARLCRKMMEQISPQVQDEGIKNPEGKPIAGGQLFRKYLLNRCQEDFERGWVAKEATAAAAASKAVEDQAVAKANADKKGEGDNNGDGEVALYSEEYYAAQKAKRQGLGLIRFIGELFKLQMLTERIMHECVKKLLGNVDNPEEEEIESLCKLLTTVGQLLDTPKAKAHMDVYFSRMKELTRSQNVSSRMQFMLQDVIELRERRWIARNAVAAPQTIGQIRETAAKEKAAQEKESYIRGGQPMSRSGSRRGGDRSEANAVGPDGWAVAGGAPRAPPKAGDLSKFGQISNKGAPMTFGPSSVFAGKNKEAKRESLSRTNSSVNMFQMLQSDAAAEASNSKSSRPPSRKASVDLGHGGEPPQRRKLVLQPRSKPLEADAGRAPDSENNSDEDGSEESEVEMSESDAKKKIEEDLKEFFAVRNIDEAEDYFEKLPSQHHQLLVDKLISKAVESKQADAELVGDLFKRASSKNLCSPSAFEQAFASIAEFLDDIAIDAPKAPALFAIMLKGAGLTDEQRTSITSKSEENGRKVFELSS